MKLKYAVPATALTLAATLVAAPLVAQSTQNTTPEAVAQEMLEPSIDFATALQTAQQSGEGEVIGMELEYLENAPVYVVEMESETSVTMLGIDAMTGEVLASEVLKAKDAETLEMLFDAEFDDEYDDDDKDCDDDHHDRDDEEEEDDDA